MLIYIYKYIKDMRNYKFIYWKVGSYMKSKLKVITCAIIIMMLFVSCGNNTANQSNTANNNTVANSSAVTNAANTIDNNTAASNQTTNTDKNGNAVSNNGNKKVIVIDPGHANRSNLEKEALAPGSSVMKIKDGGGAEGVATKTPEYRVNMQVAVKLKSLLEARNYTVVMTKTSDSESLGNIERAEIGNKANANLVIRLHADSSDSASARGASILVPSPINDGTKAIYAKSRQYGTTILNVYCSDLGLNNRGVQEHSDMTGFNWSTVPVVLIEMGFLSNPDEDRLLSDANFETKIANALADGISKTVN